VVTIARPPSSPPLIVAHRGGAPGDVENSLAAFEHAMAIGVDLIECDLRRSSDGVIVLFHDERVNGERVRSLTARELRKRIPTLLTLDDLLMLVAGRTAQTRLVLDLKERGIEDDLIPVLEQRPDVVRSVMISTVHMLSVRRLADRFPGLRLALSRGHLVSGVPIAGIGSLLARISRPVYPLWMAWQMRWCSAQTVALQHRLIDAVTVRRFHRIGYRVYAWTIDDLATAEDLAGAGVDFIASNEPWELMGRFGRHVT
jgi:glycerophosphoryl diester phosphodiesterase